MASEVAARMTAVKRAACENLMMVLKKQRATAQMKILMPCYREKGNPDRILGDELKREVCNEGESTS